MTTLHRPNRNTEETLNRQSVQVDRQDTEISVHSQRKPIYEDEDDTPTLKESLYNDMISCLAEFMGTFFFIFISLSIIQNVLKIRPNDADFDSASLLTVATGFGFGLTAACAMIGHVSGGHLNPAVSLACLVIGRISPIRCVVFIISQMMGGTLGAWAAKYVTPGYKLLGFNALVNSTTIRQGFLIEVILTASLVFVYLSVVYDERNLTPTASLYVGLTCFTAHLVGTTLTGTSINPARSFSASVIGQHWENHWLFWVAPFTGALIAAFLWKILRVAEKKRSPRFRDAL